MAARSKPLRKNRSIALLLKCAALAQLYFFLRNEVGGSVSLGAEEAPPAQHADAGGAPGHSAYPAAGESGEAPLVPAVYSVAGGGGYQST